MKRQYLVILGIILVFAIVLTGCGPKNDSASKSDSTAVEDTIRSYYSVYNSGDYEKCVSYFYNLGAVDQGQLKIVCERMKASTEKIKIESIEVTTDGSTATATIKMTSELFLNTDGSGSRENTEVDSLIKKDGDWKLVVPGE